MELELTQEIDRLNSEVDTLRSQVTFWEEKSDHRKERIKELKQFHEWNKSAALKWNEEKQNNEKLKKENAELKAGLVSGDLNLCSAEGIDMFHKLKAENEKLKEENEKLKKELERTEKEKNNHKKFIDILEERLGCIGNNYCCGHEPQYNIPMDEIDERLKIKDNIDLALGPLFKIIKHLKKEHEEIKKELKEVFYREGFLTLYEESKINK